MSLKIEFDDFQVEENGKKPEEVDLKFGDVEPDIERLKQLQDHDYSKLVVVGNGGSITSFRALYYFFIEHVDIEVRIVTTQEPDYLNQVHRQSDPGETLVMPISKSGTTSSVIDATIFFLNRDYDMVPVTSDNDGALRQIAEKRDLDWIEHRDVGGRFSGATETALAPAAVAGIDFEEVRKGAEKGYRKFSGDGPAWELAKALESAEAEGYDKVLTPFYSSRLFGFYPLVVQLMHETVCKDGKGQTFLGDMGPEIQHHTNQRLFGGKQDMVTFFFRMNSYESVSLEVPEDIQEIEIKGRHLQDFDGMNLGDNLEHEMEGVRKALGDESMPRIFLTLEENSHAAVGELMAFLQIMAVYSAYLRDVDPYTQPDVEKSKKKALEQRFDQ